MDYLELFHDLLEDNRIKFNLKYHMKSNSKETLIEIKSGNDLVLRVTDSDYDNCYRQAYEDLLFKIPIWEKRVDRVLREYREGA